MLAVKSSLPVWKKSTTILRYLSTNIPEIYKDKTGLHKIETSHTNPMKLFHEWFQEHIGPNQDDQFYKVCCFATASKNGEVSSRSLILRRLDEDGVVVHTDGRSLKSKNISENPQASLVFLWNKKISDRNFTRQVRMKGSVEKLAEQDNNEIFEKEPLFAKIRSLICHQGSEVSWEELKKTHDQVLLKYHSNNDTLLRPDHTISYKIHPQYMEFYETYGPKIGDRILYTKSGQMWNITRIAA
ncbi:pyridoxine/pyridoxamine 5'-phosphate oxidase-like [Planococcus citri]|uniref:pyridoxine/pyridoxamine 5'-phosphate oxidase-like n=1 Tax=Planococcus citri TaxID=170843 RepID=UPI0031F75ACE